MTETGDRSAPEPTPPVRRITHRAVADDEPIDDATAISARRAEPDLDATRMSSRRAEPVDDRTHVATRRPAPEDAAPTAGGYAGLVDDATVLSVRRGGPGGTSAVGPRRSPSTERDGGIQGSTTSPAEPETLADDTILRPSRPTAKPAATTGEPAFDTAQPHREAYVPRAEDLTDRRAPRPPEAVVAPRAQTPSPRSLDGAGDAPTSVRPSRRLGALGRLLIIAGALLVVVVLTVVALTLLPT